MRKRSLKLSLGDEVSAKIIEVFQDSEVLVSFDGDLLRVKNQTGRRLLVGSRIHLRVVALDPLGFKIASPRLGFDRSA